MQFLAKLHEILIVISLSDIILHRLQYEMIQRQGIPFGLLASGYQVSSMMYLWGSEFWSAVFNQELRRRYKRTPALVSVILLSMLVAFTVGPSSAIAMIPRATWHQFTPPVATNSMTFFTNSTEIWPTHLVAGSSRSGHQPDKDRNGPQATLAVLSRWVPGIARNSPNLTIPVEDSLMVRSLAASDLDAHGLVGCTLASTTRGLVARELSCMWDILHALDDTIRRPSLKVSHSPRQEMFKPVVAVRCTSYNQSSTEPIYFPNSVFVGSSDDRGWKAPTSALNFSAESTKLVHLSWVELPESATKSQIGALLKVSIGMNPLRSKHEPKQVFVLPCTIEAKWLATDVWIDPEFGRSFYDSLADIVGSNLASQKSLFASGKSINFNKSWMIDSLDTPIDADANSQHFERYLDDQLEKSYNLGSIAQQGRPNHYETVVSYLLNLFLTESLAREGSDTSIMTVQTKKPFYSGNSINLVTANRRTFALLKSGCLNNVLEVGKTIGHLEAQPWSQRHYTFSRLGYAWSTDGIPIKLSIIALLVHVLMCLIHISSLLIGGWTASVMGSISAIIALAVNSGPTKDLENACAGIKCSSTWAKIVRVRDVGDSHLKLSFAGAGGPWNDGEMIPASKQVVPGRRYGS